MSHLPTRRSGTQRRLLRVLLVGSLALLLGGFLSANPVLAQPTDLAGDTALAAGRATFGVSGVFHSFTGNQMSDAYGQMFGVGVQLARNFASRGEIRVETGILIAVGDPAFPDPSWQVDSSSMETAGLPLAVTFLYQARTHEDRSGIHPYVGVGLNGYFGFERTSVSIQRVPEGDFDWNETKFRYTGGGHVLAGATVRLANRYRLLLEAMWVQGLDGSTVDLSFSAEEIAQGWEEAAKAVQRPDFNFTGPTVRIGVMW